jgi:hypothetical protein
MDEGFRILFENGLVLKDNVDRVHVTEEAMITLAITFYENK